MLILPWVVWRMQWWIYCYTNVNVDWMFFSYLSYFLSVKWLSVNVFTLFFYNFNAHVYLILFVWCTFSNTVEPEFSWGILWNWLSILRHSPCRWWPSGRRRVAEWRLFWPTELPGRCSATMAARSLPAPSPGSPHTGEPERCPRAHCTSRHFQNYHQLRLRTAWPPAVSPDRQSQHLRAPWSLTVSPDLRGSRHLRASGPQQVMCEVGQQPDPQVQVDGRCEQEEGISPWTQQNRFLEKEAAGLQTSQIPPQSTWWLLWNTETQTRLDQNLDPVN